MTTLPKVKKTPNLTDLAYLSVKKHLLDGSLVEGSRLTEESLSSQLGISKSPVREALTRLESEGLVCIESRRGAHVRRFSLQDARALYELREILEVYAVSICKTTPAMLQELADSIQRSQTYIEQGCMLSHLDEDVRYHGIIAAATENEELYRVLENIYQKSLIIRSKTFAISGPTTPAAHHRIYCALQQGDRSAAQQAMREHIAFVRNGLLASLQSLEPIAEPLALSNAEQLTT